MTTCPYCTSEQFTSDTPSRGEDFVNQCYDCKKFSLYKTSEDLQLKLQDPSDPESPT